MEALSVTINCVNFTLLGYAFLGGLLPALIWLYFLLKEDAAHPEPKQLIALAFILGMLAVAVALPAEQWACSTLTQVHLLWVSKCKELTTDVLVAWALIEEVLKYLVAAVFILWRRAVDEAPDYVIYMLTVALGFAAAENMLFILSPLIDGHVAASVLTGNVRFLGSTLLHVVASSAIGFAMAFSKGAGHLGRLLASALGLILAIALHTAFNTLTISAGASTTLIAFFLVWMGAVIFFPTFEVLRYFQSRN